MNWYKIAKKELVTLLKVMAAAPLKPIKWDIFEDNGVSYIALSGPGTYDARTTISKLGFRWNREYQQWEREESFIMTNPNAASMLASIGVNIPTAPTQAPAPPIKPQIPVQPKQVAPPVAKQPVKPVTWFLVNRLSDGEQIAVSQSPISGFDWVDINGEKGNYNQQEVVGNLQSVKDSNGKMITSLDPIDLLTQTQTELPEDNQIPDQQPQQATTVRGPEVEQPPDGSVQSIKGRIPPENITPEQQQIEEDFKTADAGMMIKALAGTGKAQPLDSLLLTPDGWIEMRDVSIGSEIYGSDGMPHKVIGVFPQGEKEVFEVTFTDGEIVKCCGDHLWTTETKLDRDLCRYNKQPVFSRTKTRTTKEVLNSLSYRNRVNHYVPLIKPVVFPHKKVSIDPYVMGILLGDGSFRTGCVSYSTIDHEVITSVNDQLPSCLTSRYTGYGCDYRISSGVKGRRNEIVAAIKKLGLWKKGSSDKFIPNIYKYNDIKSRIKILQGLLDSDGYVSQDGYVIEFSSTSKQLSNDMKFIIESLGGTAKITMKQSSYTYKSHKKRGKVSFRIHVKLPPEIQPFKLKRKCALYLPSTKYHARRAIVSIQKIQNAECQCIAIDAPDNLYVTNGCVLTHNTTMLRDLSWKFGDPSKQKWLYLVFNTKNKVEAKAGKFPAMVDVATTNGFLGQMIDVASKSGIIPNTTRIKQLQGKPKEGESVVPVPDKLELLVDGPQFAKILQQSKLPSPQGINFDNYDKYQKGALSAAVGQIRGDFRKGVIKLTNLCKAFAVDPRDNAIMKQQMSEVVQKYDIDFNLDDLKERISKYKEPFRTDFIYNLTDILGYNLMQKTFQPEMISAAEWLLKESLPANTTQKFLYKGQTRNLGEYRDFGDDLWYAALYADKMKWTGFTHVLADEVQDFNRCQEIALKKLKGAGAKVVAVGDPNQAINRFRGAGDESFDDVAVSLGNVKQNTLSKNFRSLPNLIKFANDHGMEGIFDIKRQIAAKSKDPALIAKTAQETKNYLVGGVRIQEKDLAGYLSTPPITPEDQQYMATVLPKYATADGKANVQALLKAINSQQEAWPPALSGEAHKEKVEYDDVFKNLGEQWKKNKKIDQSAMICRTNAPLAGAALQLLAQGIPFVVVGKDVSGDLQKHIQKLLTVKLKDQSMSHLNVMNDNTPINNMMQKLDYHLAEEQRAHANKASKIGYLQDLSDTTQALLAAIGHFAPNLTSMPQSSPDDDDNANFDDSDGSGAPPMASPRQPKNTSPTIKEFKRWLGAKLKGLDIDGTGEQAEKDALEYINNVENNKENCPVILTSAHKSKGLEFDNVYILRDDLVPHPKSKRLEDLLSEAKLRYVMYTRGKKKMIVVKLEGQPGYKKK